MIHTYEIRYKTSIKRSDGVWIPFDEANSDYKEYLEWVAEGNVAEEWNPEEAE
jgi:hypothetical protein